MKEKERRGDAEDLSLSLSLSLPGYAAILYLFDILSGIPGAAFAYFCEPKTFPFNVCGHAAYY